MREKKVAKRAKKSQNQAKYKRFEKEQRKEEKRLAKKRKKLRDKKQMQMLEVANSRTNTMQTHAKKKKHKRNYTLYYIMLAFFIAITGVVLSVTILFNIQTVSILDPSLISDETFAYITGIEVGDNLFRINPETAAKKLILNDLTLDSVTIKRKFPSSVEVEAVKCEPTSIVESSGLMYVLSQSGRLIEILEENIYPQIMCISINAPEDFAVGDYLDPNLYKENETVNLILTAVEKTGVENITYIHCLDSANIHLIYNQNTVILLGNTTELEYKLKMVAQVLKEEDTQGRFVVIDSKKAGSAYVRSLENIDKYLPGAVKPGGEEIAPPQLATQE